MSLVLLLTALPSIAAAQQVIPGYSISTLAEGAPFIGSGGISVAPDGRVLVVDAFGNDISGDRVFEVTTQGVVTSIFEPPGDCFFTIGEIEATDDGGFLVWSACRQSILKVAVDGSATVRADFSGHGGGGGLGITAVLGMAIDDQGDVLAASPLTDQVFRITQAGQVSVHLTSAQISTGLHSPMSLQACSDGDLLIVDMLDEVADVTRVIRVSPSGATTIQAEGSGMRSVAYDEATGDVYATSGTDSIIRIEPNLAVTTIGSGFTGLIGLAFGPATSGTGSSLFASQEGLSIEATDGDAIFEIKRSQCSDGRVNAGVGPSVDVLFANGSAGTPGDRTVAIGVGERIDIELVSSPSGPANGTFVIWVWLGSSSRPTDLSLGSNIGCTVNPTPLDPDAFPQPHACLRGAGIPRVACGDAREIASPYARLPWPGPLSHRGFNQPIKLTLQGVIRTVDPRVLLASA